MRRPWRRRSWYKRIRSWSVLWSKALYQFHAFSQKEATNYAKAWNVHFESLCVLGAAAVPDLLRGVNDKDAGIVIVSLLVLAEDGDQYSDFPHQRVVAALLNVRESQSKEMRPYIQATISCIVKQEVRGPYFLPRDMKPVFNELLPSLNAYQHTRYADNGVVKSIDSEEVESAGSWEVGMPSERLVTSKKAHERVKDNPKLVRALVEGLATAPCIELSDLNNFFAVPPPDKVAWAVHLYATCNLGVAALPDLLRAVNDKDPGIVMASLMVLLVDSDKYSDFPHERVLAALLDAQEKQPKEVRRHIQLVISHIVMQQTDGFFC